MIVTADLHLAEETEGIVFDAVLPGLLASAREEAPTRAIAILGDLYHIRYRVSVRLQNRLYNFLAESGADWILLPGNHDQIDVQGEHALEVFRDLPNVTVKSEPGWDMWGLWVPYRKNMVDIQRALAQPKPDRITAVAWLHHGVQGYMMNDCVRDTQGIPTESFNGFERVFCGHYHMAQDLGFLSYIGSPYQTRADESGQQKRIGSWDPISREMRFISVNWGRKFHRIEATVDNPIDLAHVDLGDEIRIQAGSGVDPEALGKRLVDQGYKNVVITPVQEKARVRLNLAAASTRGCADYAQGYVDQFCGELAADKLMKLYKEITEV